ncbi:MAG: hypothetical protein Q7T16_04915 [Candidatus Burarchaeum sp.]|nr:hypothetical protein [Candidatus Burarchaeum sp.]MDO8339971.1 hypothetical protein [Candidatus Burarchaeum sp.]
MQLFASNPFQKPGERRPPYRPQMRHQELLTSRAGKRESLPASVERKSEFLETAVQAKAERKKTGRLLWDEHGKTILPAIGITMGSSVLITGLLLMLTRLGTSETSPFINFLQGAGSGFILGIPAMFLVGLLSNPNIKGEPPIINPFVGAIFLGLIGSGLAPISGTLIGMGIGAILGTISAIGQYYHDKKEEAESKAAAQYQEQEEARRIDVARQAAEQAKQRAKEREKEAVSTNQTTNNAHKRKTHKTPESKPKSESVPDFSFIFRMPDGREVGRVYSRFSDLKDILQTAPIQSLVYHANRGDFSRWCEGVDRTRCSMESDFNDPEYGPQITQFAQAIKKFERRNYTYNDEGVRRVILDTFNACFPSGRFIFWTPNGTEVGRAKNLLEWRNLIRTAPIESVVYHANRGDFSGWLDVVNPANFSPSAYTKLTQLGRLIENSIEVKGRKYNYADESVRTALLNAINPVFDAILAQDARSKRSTSTYTPRTNVSSTYIPPIDYDKQYRETRARSWIADQNRHPPHRPHLPHGPR